MNYEALTIFAVVSSITPGPNNIMLWGSGMNFGLRRTVPHALGVNLGFGSLILVTNLGLGALFERYQAISLALRILGSGYLLYLAYKVATSNTAPSADHMALEGNPASKPLTFMGAAAFQYLNPKAWVMSITAAGAFLPEDLSVLEGSAKLTAVFVAANLPCIMVWAAAGSAIGRLLTNEAARRTLNIVLALLLVGTVYLINI